MALRKRFLTLRDLRIAKFDKRVRELTCNDEFEAFLSALERVGGDSKLVPRNIQSTLSHCMEEVVSTSMTDFNSAYLITNW